MSDLPRKAVTRTAKLAALPLGFAGRATWGLGKRIGGKSAEIVAREATPIAVAASPITRSAVQPAARRSDTPVSPSDLLNFCSRVFITRA